MLDHNFHIILPHNSYSLIPMELVIAKTKIAPEAFTD